MGRASANSGHFRPKLADELGRLADVSHIAFAKRDATECHSALHNLLTVLEGVAPWHWDGG